MKKFPPRDKIILVLVFFNIIFYLMKFFSKLINNYKKIKCMHEKKKQAINFPEEANYNLLC